MLETVDKIEISCKTNIEDIIGGYIRFFENVKLGGNEIKIIRQISNDIYMHCEEKDIINNKIGRFKKLLNNQGDSKILSYYKDAINFLQNYTVHNNILSTYKKSISKDKKVSLYEFLLKIGDVFEGNIRYSERDTRKLDRPHTKLKLNNYGALGKKLLESNREELTISYSEIEEIIQPTKLPKNFKKDKLFWWDKESISAQSKAWRDRGYVVANYDNEKETVTFIRNTSVFEYNEELLEDTDINEETLEKEVNNVIQSNEDQNEENLYSGRPKDKKNPIIDGTGSEKYPRDPTVAARALKIAGYVCEVNSEHPSFIRKSDGENYTEPHHLIPISAYKEFQYCLDREENICSLCSNCHNLLHYGIDSGREQILRDLYDERTEILNKVGLSIDFEKLKTYYGIV